jgi:hypothetical protein
MKKWRHLRSVPFRARCKLLRFGLSATAPFRLGVGAVCSPDSPVLLPRTGATMRIAVQRAVRLESTPDLESDRADLDGEHPVAPVQDADAVLKCLFGFSGGAQDRD